MPLSQLDPQAALIVLDLQKGIVGIPGIPAMDETIDHSATLARAFRERNLPVVLVNVTAPAPGRTDTPRPNLNFPPDWTDLLPALEPAATDILISKQSPGAFIGTTMHEELQRRGVTQVILTGVATSQAVIATARTAFDHGYHVVFVSDAMTDFDLAAQDFLLTSTFPRIGEVTTTSELLKQLETR